MHWCSTAAKGEINHDCVVGIYNSLFNTAVHHTTTCLFKKSSHEKRTMSKVRIQLNIKRNNSHCYGL